MALTTSDSISTSSSSSSSSATLNGPVTKKLPIRLKNYSSNQEYFDSLYLNAKQAPACSENGCLGSIMYPSTYKNSYARPKEEVLPLAKDFLDQYYASIKRLNSPAYLTRWEQVQKDIENTGSYQLTETELVFGAKLAWRNASRCIGRIQWAKLQVFDCRSVTTTSNMFEAICNHIKYSTNKGNIRSAITVFAQRTDGKHDFRVWNPQLLSYAGYKNPDGSIIGDPNNVEFTEVCLKLGWKSKRADFEILPLVLSANGHDPDYFDIPPELILEVNLSHPTFEWFEQLGFRWYCVPAVSNMMFDCGGLQFTACPFNGWYMSTEIACRDLCDPHRYNITEKVARKMGLDTRSNMSLWKDKAMVEVNLAVLHSFQMQNITIMDHHTAAESFMKHYENEQRARNGCPADWVWIVPPTSASITPVFHQEMCNYILHPFYDYQEAAWKLHEWKKNKGSGKTNKIQRKFHFKQIARAVKFTSKLFGQALSKRIKATILYATETGKSEAYAQKLGEIFSHAFHSQVVRMDEYDMSSIEHEAVLLVVTSTFGNGDPPENGHSFAQSLYSLKMDHQETKNGPAKENAEFCSASFIKANSLPEQAITEKQCLSKNSFDDDLFGPLGNVRFAVFALGSSAYPNFCAFGTYVDNLLGELGGERLVKVTNGDEMCGQETAFKKWAAEVFKVALETFCLENEDDTLNQIDQMLHDVKISASTVRFRDAKEETPLNGLARCHNRKISKAVLQSKKDLHKDVKTDRATLLLELAIEGATYAPGDHVGVFPCNRTELVDGIIAHLEEPEPDKTVELQLLKEKQTSTGVEYIWMAHEKLPSCSLRSMLTRYLDITTPPSPNLLRFFATLATDQEDKDKLTALSSDNVAYEDWRHSKYPHLLEVFQEFPSVKPPAALLVSQLTLLQPRFYSISSSPMIFPKRIHLTVAVVAYNTQDGKGPLHYGVCSNYLQDAADNEDVYIFVRSAPNFHLPAEVSKPLVLVGPGTGIAPFRSFWQHRAAQKKVQAIDNLGKVILFFGCRLKTLDLYSEEKQKMVEEGVLNETHLALSREPNVPKAYVQDLMKTEAEKLYKEIVTERGHFYVCGDCKMAEDVYQTLRTIIQEKSGMTYAQAESYLLRMRDENRYHEDIFGITLRTAEVHTQSRETARIRMASESIP
ncbi:nitric oxide synthase, salivary gland isoform X2 [Planococcus citri]|uniref:nitric oxide synthase, salivary gland isoform X2 n=1 Tax=Planococcus citri TaxID=170843 RepID=UPI0031F8B620